MKTSTLLLLLLLPIGILISQIGVNTTTPEQALDVNGKIRLADDATAPSDGTLRYYGRTGNFEGYSDGQWKNLSKSAAGPTNPEPYFGYAVATEVGSGNTVVWQPWTSNTTFTTVPAGKYLLITQIYYRDNNIPNDDRFVAATLKVQKPSGYEPKLYWLGLESNLLPIKGSLQDPVFILRPGDYFTLYHESSSQETFIHAELRGFLVDDLNF